MFNSTPRATKKAYFSDTDGGHIIEFQFSPAELELVEGGNFIERDQVGRYFNDSMWVSGKASPFEVQLFIDRTAESYLVEGDSDPFEQVKRHPSRFSKYANLDIVNFVKGIANSRSSSAFAPSFNREKGGNFKPSVYSSSPDFKQNKENTNGVLNDVEALMYYVRPQGLDISEQTSQTNSELFQNADKKTEVRTVTIKDFKQGRFIPPPKIRFYFGNMWREGYIEEVRYTLSIMDKELVPQRMDAKIKINCSRWGYLNSINPQMVESAPNYTFDKSKIPV